MAAWIEYGPAAPLRSRLLDERFAFRDGGAVPQRPVLIREQHQIPLGVGPRGAACVDQQHQREQSLDLRLVRQELFEDAAEANRLVGKVRAQQCGTATGGVGLGERDVDDAEDRRQAAGQLVRSRDAVRDLRLTDLALRPRQPLGHRRLRHQERPGDLGGRQPARYRRVSATRPSKASAGWQQVKNRRSRSSAMTFAPSGAGAAEPASSRSASTLSTASFAA